MEEETKYRVEDPEEDKEKPGIMKPLPDPSRGDIPGRKVPIVKFLGITMRESRRDLLVLLLIPLLVAIIDANIYALVVIDVLEDTAFYVFTIPALAAIPIGLIIPQTGRALLGAFMAGVFFVVVFLLFLTSPSFMTSTPFGDFFISGMIISMIYLLFVIFASLIGTLVGIIIREFF
jgi:hypothetical protein